MTKKYFTLIVKIKLEKNKLFISLVFFSLLFLPDTLIKRFVHM